MNISFSEKLINLFSICFFALVLLAPSIYGLGVSDSSSLGGAVKKSNLVELSFSSVYSGNYQKYIATKLRKDLSLRGKMVRSVNQLYYSLFSIMATRSQTPLILGDKNMLFEKSYVDSYNRIAPLPIESIESIASKLDILDLALAERGIKLLLVITPSKAEFHSDLIPKQHIRSDRLTKNSDIELFLKETNRLKLDVFDTRGFLKQLSTESDYPIFTKGGTHWSEFAACNVSSEIAKQLERSLNKKLGKVSCQPVKESLRAKYSDNDILRLANIWDNKPFNELVAYPIAKMSFSWEDYHPRALVIGDSFTWMPLRYFDRSAIFSKRKFYYYFRTQTTSWFEKTDNGSIKRRTGAKRKINRAEINWQNDLINRDVVLIFVNEIGIRDVGHGFIGSAISRLNTPK